MSSSCFTDSTVEDAALDWLRSLGWRDLNGPDIGPDTPAAAHSAPTDSQGYQMADHNPCEWPSIKAEAAGARFAAGVGLYDGESSASFGEGLYAVPIRALWETT